VIFGHGADGVPVPPFASTTDPANSNGVFHVSLGLGDPNDPVGTQAGYAVSYAGDFNGDGVGDFMVSTPYYNGQQGATYIVFGSTGLSDGNPTGAISIKGGNTSVVGDMSGYSVAAIGDVNGDGFDDVLIGSPHAAGDGRLWSGVSYVVYVTPRAPTSISPISTRAKVSASLARRATLRVIRSLRPAT
jgi:hypothetical protein